MVAPYYRTTDPLLWGTGLPDNLTPHQFDENTYRFETRIQYLYDNPPEAVSIDHVEVTGNQFTIFYTDLSTDGPFELPTAVWNFRKDVNDGEWAPSTAYQVLDIFTYNGAVYQVLFAHVSDLTFDPGANDGLGHDYYGQLLESPGNVIPAGGTIGQILRKSDYADYILAWDDEHGVPIGGTEGQVLVKNSATDYDVAWAPRLSALADMSDVGITAPSTGQFLVYDEDEAAWLNVSVPLVTTPATLASATYTLLLTDSFTFQRVTVGCDITIPNESDVAFPVGTVIEFHAETADPINFLEDTDVTLDYHTSFSATLNGEFSTAALKKKASDLWVLVGQLAPA